MNVKSKIIRFINSQEFLAYLIALILSTLFIGYAPSSIAMGIFVFFALRYAIIHKYRPKIDFKLVLPMVLYILFALTLFWTVNESFTMMGLSSTIALFLIPFVFNIIPRFSLKLFNLILEIFTGANLIFGLFFLIWGCIRYFNLYSLSVFTYHELVSVFDLNAIYVSLIFSISLFYLLSKKDKTRIEDLKIIFLSFLVLLLSSKIILFVLVLGFLIYNISHQVNKDKLIVGFAIAILIAGIATRKSVERILFEKQTSFEEVFTKNEFGQVYLWTGTSIRLLQLRILKDQIKEESIFWKGFGLFASRDNLIKRHIQFDTYYKYHKYHYHNQYAQILSETGIVGLLLLLGMLGVLVTGALKSKNFLFIMFSITIIFVFFTESLLVRQIGLFIFILLYCLFNRTIFVEKEQLKI